MGLNVTVGGRVWDRQYKFRLIFGPLEIDDFKRMLPGGEHLPRLLALVRNYVGDELAWDVNLVLKKEQVPPCRLGAGVRLGWSTWVSSSTPARDADHLYLQPLRYAAGLDTAESIASGALLFDDDGMLVEAES